MIAQYRDFVANEHIDWTAASAGTIDESIRHAVTKMSHVHFPATKDAADRIIMMGEEPENVYQVGCPYIDIINSIPKKTKKELSIKYNFSEDKELIIFTQHSVTTEYGNSYKQINKTLTAGRSPGYFHY